MPTLITTPEVRGSNHGESHGGVYLVDLEDQETRQVVDWNTANIGWQGRDQVHGLRGFDDTGSDVEQVNCSRDNRNTVHGLEVWPY